MKSLFLVTVSKADAKSKKRMLSLLFFGFRRFYSLVSETNRCILTRVSIPFEKPIYSGSVFLIMPY